MTWSKNRMGMTLWSLKYINRLIIRLKAIKYKEDFFYYLSFYLDLGLQAAYLQILSSRLHIFRSFLLGCMLSGFLTKHICASFGSQICFNNLNFIPYAESLIDQISKAHIMATSQLFFAIISNYNWADSIPRSHICYIQ